MTPIEKRITKAKIKQLMGEVNDLKLAISLIDSLQDSEAVIIQLNNKIRIKMSEKSKLMQSLKGFSGVTNQQNEMINKYLRCADIQTIKTNRKIKRIRKAKNTLPS